MEEEEEGGRFDYDPLNTRSLRHGESSRIESSVAMDSLAIDEHLCARDALIESDADVCVENENDCEEIYYELGAPVDGNTKTVKDLSLSLAPVREAIECADEYIEQKTSSIEKNEEGNKTSENVSEPNSVNLERVKGPMHESATDVLQQHSKHVFIFTSPGKPVFSRYGDENDFSELFGILRVLFAMARGRDENYSSSETEQKTAPSLQNGLRRATAGNVTFYFYEEGELYYVIVLRNGVEGHRSLFRQLRQLHMQIVSLVPNVMDILARAPSYDLRRLVSSADACLLRKLIKRNSTEETYIFRCLAAAPLSLVRRRMLESILSQHCSTRRVRAGLRDGSKKTFQEEERGKEKEEEEEEHHLVSFLFFRGRVICAVGSKARPVRLHIDDALLLVNFTRSLTQTQFGECWAPICLPNFNNTGYIWCYCVNLNTFVRESQSNGMRSGFTPRAREFMRPLAKECHNSTDSREENQKIEEKQERERAKEEDDDDKGRKVHDSRIEASVKSPTNTGVPHDSLTERMHSDFSGSEGILLVHLATSQEAFEALAEQSYRIAQSLTSVITEVEEELVQRTEISLAMVSSHKKNRTRTNESMMAIHLAEQKTQSLKLEKLLAVAAEKALHEEREHMREPEASSSTTTASASVHYSVSLEANNDANHKNSKNNNNEENSETVQHDMCRESTASTSIFLDKDGLQWFAAVLKVPGGRDANLVYSAPSMSMRACPRERKRQLRLLARLRDQISNHSQTAEPLLIVRMHNVCALVMRSTQALIASLVRQFCRLGSDGREEGAIPPSDVITAGTRVCELFLLFLPHVTNQCMLSCAMRLLVRLVEHEEDLSFRQISSCRDRR